MPAKKKSASKKSAAKKSSAKKSSSKKTSAKKKSKYGPKVSASVEREMKAMKQGKLKSGRSGKKVTSRKQAIAIGLSEARRSGAKVPPAKKSSKK
jgi:Family of unknown function (DUF6496)